MSPRDVRTPVRPLLTVKQLIPPVRPGAVPRTGLEHRLRDADTGLTMVVAPAGWGKTSLLSSWASNPGEGVRVAWVSLDESDDEPTRFWSYVLTALRGASDEISPAALDALAASRVDPVDLALPILLNELAASRSHMCWCWMTFTCWAIRGSTRESSSWSRTCRRRCDWWWPAARIRRCRSPGCGPGGS